MKKQKNIISIEEFTNFRKKYGFSRVELIPVLDQRVSSIDNFELGRLGNLDNQEFVKELMNDEKKLFARIQELYRIGKVSYRTYVKVLDNKENIDEDHKIPKGFKYIDKDLQEKINNYQEKYKISDNVFTSIFGITQKKLDLIRNEGLISVTKEIIIKEALSDKNNLIRMIENSAKKGTITNRTRNKLVDNIVIVSREERNVENPEQRRNRYIRKENRKDYLKEYRIGNKQIEDKENKVAKLKLLLMRKRKLANTELQREIDGKKFSYSYREQLIEFVYTMFENGSPIDAEDIELIKYTIIHNNKYISNYTLKIIILGALRSQGYEVAKQNINELISEIKDKDYYEKLKKFNSILEEEHTKILVNNMYDEGSSKEDIRKKLHISLGKINKFLNDDEGRI